MPNPRFESQTKRKLVRDNQLEKALEEFMRKNMPKFLRKNKDYLELVMDRAKSRHKFQMIKEASKKGRKAKKQKIEKLLDANERKDRSLCTLFICEGDSAIGGLRSARNRLYQGGIALKGKPMNVAQSNIKDVVNNQEFMDIMASIGLTLGQPVDFEKMRYSKIVFLSDSDVDGGHINTLLTNFFYTFWPELFDEGAIQIAKAPLYEVETDGGVKFFETPDQLEDHKKKGGKIKAIHRNKGLGEMSPDAWKYVMAREEYTKIDVSSKKDAKQILNVCFGKDSSPRKDLLMDHSNKEAEEIMVSSTKGTDQALKKLRKTSKKKKTTKKKSKKKQTAKKTTKKTKKKNTKKKSSKKIKKKAKKKKSRR